MSCAECGATGGRIHAFSCSRYPDVQKTTASEPRPARLRWWIATKLHFLSLWVAPEVKP